MNKDAVCSWCGNARYVRYNFNKEPICDKCKSLFSEISSYGCGWTSSQIAAFVKEKNSEAPIDKFFNQIQDGHFRPSYRAQYGDIINDNDSF